MAALDLPRDVDRLRAVAHGDGQVRVPALVGARDVGAVRVGAGIHRHAVRAVHLVGFREVGTGVDAGDDVVGARPVLKVGGAAGSEKLDTSNDGRVGRCAVAGLRVSTDE